MSHLTMAHDVTGSIILAIRKLEKQSKTLLVRTPARPKPFIREREHFSIKLQWQLP